MLEELQKEIARLRAEIETLKTQRIEQHFHYHYYNNPFTYQPPIVWQVGSPINIQPYLPTYGNGSVP